MTKVPPVHRYPHLGEPSTPHVVRDMACALGGKANKIQTSPPYIDYNYAHATWEFRRLNYPQAWWQGHLKKKLHESEGSMSWSELNTSLIWQCTVPANFCLLDPIAPLPILHLQGVWDISTLITAEHKHTWLALKDVVSEGEEALKRSARAKALTQAPPKLPIYARPRMT